MTKTRNASAHPSLPEASDVLSSAHQKLEAKQKNTVEHSRRCLLSQAQKRPTRRAFFCFIHTYTQSVGDGSVLWCRSLGSQHVPFTQGAHSPQDNLAAVEVHTQEGIDFLAKFNEFLKKRAAVEADYAKAVQKIAEQYRDTTKKGKKKKDDGKPEVS
jgi:hypothetical protein